MKSTYLCLQYWSAVWKAEVVVKFSVFRLTLSFYHFKQKQYFSSVGVIFGASIITVHSCVHLWAWCLRDHNLPMHSRVQSNLVEICCVLITDYKYHCFLDLILVHWPHFTCFLYGPEFIPPLLVIALYKNHAAMLRYIIIFANWRSEN